MTKEDSLKLEENNILSHRIKIHMLYLTDDQFERGLLMPSVMGSVRWSMAFVGCVVIADDEV